MKVEVKVPSVGEAVQEGVLAQWYKRNGERVQRDEVLFLLETDKVTLEITAEADGVLNILVSEGETVSIGAVVATIDSEAVLETVQKEAPPGKEVKGARAVEERRVEPAAPQPPPVQRPEPPRAEAPRALGALSTQHPAPGAQPEHVPEPGPSPSVERLARERGVDLGQVTGTGPGGRITRGDVLLFLDERLEEGRVPERAESKRAGVEPAPREVASPSEAAPEQPLALQPSESITRKPMSRIRLRIAERLLQARQNTAMLTTFNEIDMSQVQAMRARFKDKFREKHGVSLGLMSFFIKAVTVALKEIPELNAFIEGNEIVHHHYYHIGVAVGAERGLVVPVIRHADWLSFAAIEKEIVRYVKKIEENRLELSDLEGGTFTITNGGVFGSLLSTPILNTPQSGILGMHKIEDRPVVIEGQIVIRPMMYVALSYDHRMVDGREAVTFLKRIKECIENPERIMMEI